MDIDEEKIGVWPNVAIEAGRNPDEVMEQYGVEPQGLRTAAYDYERRIAEMEDERARMQRVIDTQRESFQKMEAELAATRRAALALWRKLDAVFLAGRPLTEIDVSAASRILDGIVIEVS